MATYQSGQRVRITYKAETTIGVAVTGTGGYEFRKSAGAGLQLSRPEVTPTEVRADGKRTMGTLGSKNVAGSYGGDLSVGSFDALLEAVLRSNWSTAATITEATATLTSITTDATSIVAGAGSWLNAGIKVGDVFRLTGHAAAGNNDRNLRATAVTTLTLSVAETLVVNSTADTAFTITRAKKVIQGTTPVDHSFTFDEYNEDLDISKVYRGCRVSSMKITGQPDATALVEVGIVGMDMEVLSTANSPSLTSATLSTTVPLNWVNATIRLGGVDVSYLTGFEINIDLSGQTLPIIGGNVSPDVWLSNANISGSFTYLLADFAQLSAFTAETEFEFHGLLVEPESEPKDFLSIFMPRLKWTSFSDPQGNDGAKVATSNFITGTKGSAAGYDDSMISFSTSAA